MILYVSIPVTGIIKVIVKTMIDSKVPVSLSNVGLNSATQGVSSQQR